MFLIVVGATWEAGQGSELGAVQQVFTGTASYYGPGFEGQTTASGETFRSNQMTAAHRTLPLGSTVRVTNLENNKQVVVEITDRGPYVRDRVIDLSLGAAQRIHMKDEGLALVRVEVVSAKTAH